MYTHIYTHLCMYIYIYIQGELRYEGNSIHDRTIQGRPTIRDQYNFPRCNTIVWGTIQDRAPPLTHRMCSTFKASYQRYKPANLHSYTFIYVCMCIYIYI